MKYQQQLRLIKHLHLPSALHLLFSQLYEAGVVIIIIRISIENDIAGNW